MKAGNDSTVTSSMETKLLNLFLLTMLGFTIIACDITQLHESSEPTNTPINPTSIISPVELDQVSVGIAERQTWYEVIHWSDTCENEWQSQETERENDWGGVVFDKVDLHKYVVTVLCYAGPYWISTEFFLLNNQSTLPESEPLPLDLIHVDNDGELVRYSTNNISGGIPHFDPETRTLIYVYKFRGVGGCGYYYQLEFAQNHFVLQEARYREVCDDTLPPPEEWKRIY